jgi:hypothetical protein
MSEDHSDDEEEGWSPERDKDPLKRLMDLFEKYAERGLQQFRSPSPPVMGYDFDSVSVRRVSNGFLVCYHELLEDALGAVKHQEIYAATLDGVKEILLQKFGAKKA